MYSKVVKTSLVVLQVYQMVSINCIFLKFLQVHVIEEYAH